MYQPTNQYLACVSWPGLCPCKLPFRQGAPLAAVVHEDHRAAAGEGGGALAAAQAGEAALLGDQPTGPPGGQRGLPLREALARRP